MPYKDPEKRKRQTAEAWKRWKERHPDYKCKRDKKRTRRNRRRYYVRHKREIAQKHAEWHAQNVESVSERKSRQRDAIRAAHWLRSRWFQYEKAGLSVITRAHLESPMFIVKQNGQRRYETLHEPLPKW